jgi:Leucine-rich repeat (LRR) protein
MIEITGVEKLSEIVVSSNNDNRKRKREVDQTIFYEDELESRSIALILNATDKNSFDQLAHFGIEILNMKNINLICVPRQIGNLSSSLLVLNLFATKLETLPEEIYSLDHLEKLNLGSNSIDMISESIGNLRNLTKLYIENNSLEELPENIGTLLNLNNEGLRIYGNPLNSLPDSIVNVNNAIDLKSFAEYQSLIGNAWNENQKNGYNI